MPSAQALYIRIDLASEDYNTPLPRGLVPSPSTLTTLWAGDDGGFFGPSISVVLVWSL